MATRKSTAPLVIPLAIAAGGGLLWALKAKARETDESDDIAPSRPKPTPRPLPEIPTAPPTLDTPRPPQPVPQQPEKRRLFGSPFVPGEGNEQHNALIACRGKPVRHPNGFARGATQKLDDWLANIAYWETYPSAPTIITNPVREKKFAESWLRIRGHIRKCLRITPKKETEPKFDTPKSGTKFPDRAAEIRNAALAVEQKPQTYPRLGPPFNQRQPDQPLNAYLANVAYWETYPGAPVKLNRSRAHAKYREAWMRIHGLVKVGLIKEQRNQKPAREQTVPGPSAAPKSKGGKTEPAGKPPPPKLATKPSDLSAATEMRNAAIVAVDQPTRYEKRPAPFNAWKGTNDKQKLTDWLANVAFWESYPDAPSKLDSKDARHKGHIAAWMRIRDYVARSLDAQKKVPPEPPGGGVPPRGWRIWAAAMPNASAIRRADAVVSAWKDARRFFATPDGGAIAQRDTGLKAGNRKASLSGLLAEAASRKAAGKLDTIADWKNKPTRSFWVTTELF